jgi:hypothetical protein
MNECSPNLYFAVKLGPTYSSSLVSVDLVSEGKHQERHGTKPVLGTDRLQLDRDKKADGESNTTKGMAVSRSPKRENG